LLEGILIDFIVITARLLVEGKEGDWKHNSWGGR